MKTNWLFLIGTAMLSVLVGCSVQEEDVTDVPSKKDLFSKELVFTATSGEEQTKTAFQADETSIWWSPNDVICIYYGASEGNRFTSTNDVEVPKTQFRGKLDAFTGQTETGDFNYFWAVYPYSAAVSCDGSSLVADLSNNQIAKAGSFAPNTNITIAKNLGLSLSFYNTCAWFRFSLQKEGVKRVIFRGNNNEDIAGQFRVSMGADSRPTAPEVLDGKQEIVFHLPQYEAFEVGELYYITLFPQVFQSGFTVTFETDTETGSRSITAPATYLRSKYNTGRNFDKDVVYGPKPQNNDLITFADDKVKTKLVAAFDTNSDGEISYAEAAAVTDGSALKSAFGAIKTYKSFDEFQYFTGITTIPDSMFEGWQLTSIVLPENLQSISSSAFKSCVKLASLIIPDGVTEIGDSAFYGCSSLTSIVLPDGVTYFGGSAFEGCSSLTSIVIPESVPSIGGWAFSGCSSLTSIVIPESVTEIGGSAFRDCSSLTSVVIPNSVTRIDGSTFSGCSSLTSVVIPESVTSIGGWAFQNCSSLSSVVIPESVTSIGGSAFRDCSSLTSVVIPESVTSIGGSTFEGCSSLTSVVIPESVTSIGGSAFQYCSSLTSVVIPESVTSIGGWAFQNCSSLSSVVIPESVTSIGEGAFYGCSSLTSIVIPASVISIGSSAFMDCSSLTSIIVEATTPPTGGSDMFTNTNDCPIYVLNASVDDYKSALYWSDYAGRIQASGIVFADNQVGTKLVAAFDTNNDGELSYSEAAAVTDAALIKNALSGATSYTSFDEFQYFTGITSIPGSMFQGWSSLTSIVIPDNVTSIGDNAFSGCNSLTSIVIPDNVTSIGDLAFAACSSLTSIVIPANVTSIGMGAFLGCSGLTSITVKAFNPPAGGVSMFAGSNCPIMVSNVDVYTNAPDWSEYVSRIQSFFEMVDLGLSVKWASQNLGASSPEEYGDYYAWGETQPKSDYSWATYKFELGTDDRGPFSKYVTDASFGAVDNKAVLEPEDDAAHVNLGGNWRMPTDAEWTELREQCTWTWTADYNGTGVSGRIVTGPNGNSIFLPAAGNRSSTNLCFAGSYGYYWSSSLNTDYPYYAYDVFFYSAAVLGNDYNNRYCGFSVRPVTE